MKLTKVMTVAGLLMATMLINQECQSQTAAPAATPAANAPAPAAQPAAPAVAGSIAGKVTLTGTPPLMPKLRREADPFCGKTPMTDQEVVIGPGGALKNVVVRVIKGAAPMTAPPAEPKTVSQQNCMYTPRVVGAVVGQKLVIKNTDPTMHNVHSYAGTTTLFNQAQMKGSKDIEKTVSAGITKFKCDVHPWMTGYVVASDNPFIVVTGDNGEFTLANVPAGTYTVEAWHEKYGTKTVDVTVAAGAPAKADFAFAAQ